MKRTSGLIAGCTALLFIACDSSSGNGGGTGGEGTSTLPPGPGSGSSGNGTTTGSGTGTTTGSATTGSATTGSAGTGANGTAGGGSVTGTPTGDIVFTEQPSTSADGGTIDLSQCGAVSVGAERIKSPVDIIFVIDNSSSMAGEISQVEERINADFAQIIEATGVDYRVIMLSRYGEVGTLLGESDNPICVRAPLGAGDCTSANSQPLVHNAPRFFHYSADVRSREPFCDVLDGWDSPDELKLDSDAERELSNDQELRPLQPWNTIAPVGWRLFVRENAFKHFVVITDDDSECSRRDWRFNDGSGGDREATGTVEDGVAAAAAFDQALRGLEPRQFGTAGNRKYKWHSIVGMVPYSDPTQAWQPTDPIQTEECGDGDDSDGAGTGFQALSVLTEGLRWPTCNNDNFNAIFQALAEGVVLGSLSCEWEIPELDDDEEFNPNEVNVTFTSGDGEKDTFPNVESAEDCGSDRAWYYNDPRSPTSVVACPATCDYIKADPSGIISVVFGCETTRIIR